MVAEAEVTGCLVGYIGDEVNPTQFMWGLH